MDSVSLKMSRTEELKSLITQAREEYYNLCPTVSDQQYDAWVDELHRLEPKAPEVTAVGAPAPKFSVWEKTKHEIPMGSLSKANSKEEFEEWAERAKESGANSFYITHKIDGLSMELVYKSGKLVRCVTRGDGIIGENVTSNVSQVPSIPKNLPNEVNLMIRGEIVMMKEMFQKKYASDYANPRNTAAAKVREKRDGGESCKDLNFLAYWMFMDDGIPKTMQLVMQSLRGYGFDVPDGVACSNNEDVKDEYEKATKNRITIPYEIDGMVVSVNDMKILENMGDLNMRPHGQIAWKFEAAAAETKVIDVKWQVGPTGRITPIAILEPIGIGGVTVTNVSLHNIDMFKELALYKECRVLVERRNDVIPYIKTNLGS